MTSMHEDQRALEAALHKLRRTLEMQANIMRDPRRTGAWEGAERVANAFSSAAEKVADIETLAALEHQDTVPVAELVTDAEIEKVRTADHTSIYGYELMGRMATELAARRTSPQTVGGGVKGLAEAIRAKKLTASFGESGEMRRHFNDGVEEAARAVEDLTPIPNTSAERVNGEREAALIEAAEELLEHMDGYGLIGGVDALPLQAALLALKASK